MAVYMGVDPGRVGAIALLDTSLNRIVCHDMPDTTSKLHDLLVECPVIKGCVVEKPYYPQMIGVTNATRIAMAYGTLIGALQWLDIPFREIAPSKWKAAMDLSSNKNASREAASRAFPAHADLFRLKKHDGRAEAALLALYASDNRRRWAA